MSQMEEMEKEGIEEGEVEDFLLLLDNGDLIGTRRLMQWTVSNLTERTVERSGTHTLAINGGGASPRDFINRVEPHFIENLDLELDWEEGEYPDIWRWGPYPRELLYV